MLQKSLLSAEDAREIAAGFLRTLPRRWAHVQAVGGQATRAAVALPEDERELLVVTAWLHDVGYAEPLVNTGFHSLDGAAWLRAQGHERVACLVAHHSCAAFEAELRGLSGLLAGYPDEASSVRDLLTYCDMTTGPAGQSTTLRMRLDDVEARYGAEAVVTRALRRAEPELRRQCLAAEAVIGTSQPM